MNTSALVKEAMAKAKARGVKFGNPNILKDAHPLALIAIKAAAQAFNSKIKSIVEDLRKKGYKTIPSLTVKLNEMGIKSRTGTDWTYHNLYRVLAS
jgi:hypothetical protein